MKTKKELAEEEIRRLIYFDDQWDDLEHPYLYCLDEQIPDSIDSFKEGLEIIKKYLYSKVGYVYLSELKREIDRIIENYLMEVESNEIS